jgi:hypothetical protein
MDSLSYLRSFLLGSNEGLPFRVLPDALLHVIAQYAMPADDLDILFRVFRAHSLLTSDDIASLSEGCPGGYLLPDISMIQTLMPIVKLLYAPREAFGASTQAKHTLELIVRWGFRKWNTKQNGVHFRATLAPSRYVDQASVAWTFLLLGYRKSHSSQRTGTVYFKASQYPMKNPSFSRIEQFQIEQGLIAPIAGRKRKIAEYAIV